MEIWVGGSVTSSFCLPFIGSTGWILHRSPWLRPQPDWHRPNSKTVGTNRRRDPGKGPHPLLRRRVPGNGSLRIHALRSHPNGA